MARKRDKLAEILRKWGLIDEQQAKEGLRISEGSRKRIGEILVDLDYVSENDVAKAVASQMGMEFVDLDQPNVIDKESIPLIPEDLIRKYTILPLGKEGNRIKVLVHDPMDLSLIDDLRFRLNTDIDMSLAAKGKIKEYIDRVLSSEVQKSIDALTVDMSIDRTLDTSLDMSIDMDGDDSMEEDEDTPDGQQAPIIKLVTQIITEGVTTRASDIHIEPFEDRVRLRYRIDGVCHEKQKIPKRTQGSVIARLKILSGVRVEEKRIPQDGRIKMKIGGEAIDFRVSFCPAYHGESIVLRILRPDSAKIGLGSLGMQEDTLETFNEIINRPNGIFLVTGPTGSGKTTTLYSALQELNRPDRKIITAEDPIEYNFKGINQCQVQADIGMTFKAILRSMLRQAPNVILVGEIRDMEVGDIAIQAALTGHMVFSTLHTNDAPSAITRLLDMGLKPFLVASSIQAILAQRLVRVLCDHCKEPDENPNPRYMALCGFKKAELEGKPVMKDVGCKRCGGAGYRGRRGIYELMQMNSEIRDLAFKRSTVSTIRQAAHANGMRNLLGDGKLKVLEGKTTMAEIARIAQVEGVVDESGEDDGIAA